MKFFAIRDEEAQETKDLAYLIYYEREKRFYIELPDEADFWETPLILSSFAKRGIKTVNAYWSKIWVQQRIVPPDRQNLGQILKDNGLKEYDEFELLMLADGRCAQDSYYLTEVSEKVLLNAFELRYQKRVEDVVPLTDCQLLVFFRDGMIHKCDVKALVGNDRQFAPVIKNREIFCTVEVQTGGYGVCWGENLNIPDSVLYESSQAIPLTDMDLRQYIYHRVIDTTEATGLLNCSRQNIEDLVRRGKLHPVKITHKIKLFLKSEIRQRLWK